MRTFQKNRWLWMFCFVWIVFNGERTTQAARLHIIIAADTNDQKIGESVKADLNMLEFVMQDSLSKNLYSITRIEGSRFTSSTIERTIANLNVVAGSDSILICLSCHGGYEVKRKLHFTQMSDKQPLFQNEILGWVKRKRPRVGAVLTDACSSFVNLRNKVLPAIEGRPPAKRFPPLFRTLFFESNGLVFITAAKPGDVANGTPDGGVFTLSMLDSISANLQRPMSWSEFVANINRRAKDSRNWRWQGQKWKQTAYSVLPDLSLGGASRLGVTLQKTPDATMIGGLKVTHVNQDSPCTRLSDGSGVSYSLVPFRHIITHIDGKPTPDLKALGRVLNGSRGAIQITVYSLSTRQSYNYTTGIHYITIPRIGAEFRDAHLQSGIQGAVLYYIFTSGPLTKVQWNNNQIFQLLPGRHVITAVNGVKCSGADDLDRLLSQSSSNNCVITVYSATNRITRQYRVSLYY